jgi:hemolysin D
MGLGHTLTAQPLMLIVPSAKGVEVEATMKNKDVGFVQVGQRASVKIAAFEYTKYGTVPGRVDFVSHDAVENKDASQDVTENKAHDLSYSIRILLDRPTINVQGRLVELSPGMSVDVDIKTGRRRIEYILSPLLRHEHESLKER